MADKVTALGFINGVKQSFSFVPMGTVKLTNIGYEVRPYNPEEKAWANIPMNVTVENHYDSTDKYLMFYQQRDGGPATLVFYKIV